MALGYRIRYDCVGAVADHKRGRRSGWIVGSLVLLLVLGAIAVKSIGLEWVRKVLLPGDPAVTAAALEGMVQDIKKGDSLKEAVTAFCQEIVKGAQ